MRTFRRFLGISLLLGLLAAGCGGQDATASGGTTGAADSGLGPPPSEAFAPSDDAAGDGHGPGPNPDAHDGGVSTQGGEDAGSGEDAGPGEDAGFGEDAGPGEDAGSGEDAGPGEDAGSSEDAGLTADAAMGEDAGTTTDGGPEADAGALADAGEPDSGTATLDGGAAPDWPSFALGVEYTELGLAQTYAGTGVKWAKTRLEAFSWGAVEPTAPQGGVHAYNWACTDALIREYQEAGIIHLQSYMQPNSPWGSKDPKKDPMPKPEFMADYRAWARALFERYDGDGVDDMPGLIEPVRYWVAGGEWTGFWGSGNADDYITFLEATVTEARAAYPKVKIGTIPFLLFDVFQGNAPTANEVAARLQDPPPGWRNSTVGMRKILDRHDLHDYVDIHALGDYTEIPPLLAWFRAELAARGVDRPVWIDDAFASSYYANWQPVPGSGWPTIYPVKEAQREAVYNLLVDVAKLTEPAYSRAAAWIRKETASVSAKKMITAMGHGAIGIQIGNTEDWMHDVLGGVRHATVNLLGASAMMGIIDVTHPAGYDTCNVRQAGAPRPAYYALQTVVEKLDDFETVAEVPGVPAGVWAFDFVKNGRHVVAAWFEDDVLQLPGETETPVPVALPLAGAQATVTRLVTQVGQTTPVVETAPVVAGQVTVNLTSDPVFVESGP